MADKRVRLVMSNAPDKDIRVCKEARTLKRMGYTTGLLYWGREGNVPAGATADYNEARGFRFKAPLGIMLLPFIPVWWGFVFARLLREKWDIVHALNFHAIVPSLIAGKLKRRPVIYEIIDFYEWRLPGLVRGIFLWLDKLLMRLADAVIVADEAQIEMVGGIPNGNIVVIYDSPPAAFRRQDGGHPGHQTGGDFTLFYAGALYKNRRLNLDKVVAAIKDLEGVKLIIAGYGDLADEIEEWSLHMPDKVEFIGRISYEEVIARGLSADLFFVLRDATVPTNRYTCGSNLFNAMICGKPVLANYGSSTAAKVAAASGGLVVNAEDMEQIKEAVIKLRDNPGLCQELGANAGKAYERQYSWEIMEQRLIGLYRQLTSGRKG